MHLGDKKTSQTKQLDESSGNETESGFGSGWSSFESKRWKYICPAIIIIAAVAMLWWSWGTWPDAMIDFGRELYVPWQLAEGETLYSDEAYFNGPLSPYFNSLWFRLFGVHMNSLVIANLCTIAGGAW